MFAGYVRRAISAATSWGDLMDDANERENI